MLRFGPWGSRKAVVQCRAIRTGLFLEAARAHGIILSMLVRRVCMEFACRSIRLGVCTLDPHLNEVEAPVRSSLIHSRSTGCKRSAYTFYTQPVR